MFHVSRYAYACKWVLAFGIALSVASAAPRDADQVWFRAETKPAELKQALRDDIASDRWIYHDLAAARITAKKSGKPLLAVFRCVPCGSAQALDEQIFSKDSQVASLLDQFVCARVVKMNGVNRNVFEFDRDVPYVAMILNADGTVYGRWGTRAAASRTELPRHTIGSFRTALERALKLHSDYPANRESLAGKATNLVQRPPMPEDMPTMKPHPYNPPEVKNCIHCHNVGEASLELAMRDRRPTIRELWPYPLADNIGLRLDVNDGVTIKSVMRESPAAIAGVLAGDVILRLEGQPLISEADVQWVLHHLKDVAQPKLDLLRDGKRIEVTLKLTGEWRKVDIEWRESVGPARPNINLIPDYGKEKKGIGADDMALTFASYPREGAKKAGFLIGDVVISVDGRKDLLTEADFLKYIHIDRPNARSAELVVLRKGEKLTMTLPLR